MEPAHRDQEPVILLSHRPSSLQIHWGLGRRQREPLGPPALGPFIRYPSNASSSLHPQYTRVASQRLSWRKGSQHCPDPLSRSQTDQTAMICKDLGTREHCPCPGAWVYFTALLEQDVQLIILYLPARTALIILALTGHQLIPVRASAGGRLRGMGAGAWTRSHLCTQSPAYHMP